MGRRRFAVAVAISVLGASGAAVAGAVSAATPSRPAPAYGYAVMPDGARLAEVVTFPRGFAAVHRWPVLMMMDGYEGGGGPLDPGAYDDHRSTRSFTRRS